MTDDGELPRPAASLVIVKTIDGAPNVLLGRRRPTQVFAPGTYVFPGGSVDAADGTLSTAHRLADSERNCLLQHLESDAAPLAPEAFALAAIRETFEETGLIVGTPSTQPPPSATGGWPGFYASGFAPTLAGLSVIARAITPPGRTRRFDARFFLIMADAIAHDTGANDGEFDELIWLPFEAADTRNLHSMTRAVIDEAAMFMALDAAQRRLAPMPFFFEDTGGWRRAEIAR
jgi:8-oxo-dGTP pyrophosphatase MutT (NUDIX family)